MAIENEALLAIRREINQIIDATPSLSNLEEQRNRYGMYCHSVTVANRIGKQVILVLMGNMDTPYETWLTHIHDELIRLGHKEPIFLSKL